MPGSAFKSDINSADMLVHCSHVVGQHRSGDAIFGVFRQVMYLARQYTDDDAYGQTTRVWSHRIFHIPKPNRRFTFISLIYLEPGMSRRNGPILLQL